MFTYNRLKPCLVSLALLGTIQGAIAQTSDITKTLIEQGQYWQSRGNSERAAQVWKKLLLLNPKDENGLYGLAVNELDKKNIDGAKQYYDRIVASNPKSPFLSRLTQDIRLKDPANAQKLEAARIATQNQDYKKAVENYQSALGSDSPSGPEGFEYYSALSHIQNNEKQSIEGFKRLAKEAPNDPVIQLTLAKRLIVSESTRIEGIQRLLNLTSNASVKSEAMESIREALVWFGPPRPAEFTLFNQYLKIAPTDTEIQNQLNAGIQKQKEQASAAAATAAAANRNNQTSSPTQTPTPPPDPRLLASKNAADAALARGDDFAAKKALEEALALDRNDPWTRLELAKIYMKSGQQREARGLVEGYLSSNPTDTQAIYASALLASALPDWQQALKTIDRINPKDRNLEISQFQKKAWVQTQIEYANNLHKSNRTADGLAILGQVKSVVGDDANLTGDLAGAYVDLGAKQEGIRLINDLSSKSANPSTDVLLQKAGILLKTNQDVEAAGVLKQVQSRPLTMQQKSIYEDVLFPFSVRQAESLNQSGKSAEAIQKLNALKSQRPNDTYVNGALARSYATNGNNQEAITLYTSLLEKSPNQPELLIGLAQTAAQAKNTELATQSLDKYLALDPNNAEYLDNAGKVYRSLGKNSQALKLYEKSMASTVEYVAPKVSSTNVRTLGTSPNDFYTAPNVAVTAAVAKNNKSNVKTPVVVTPPVPAPVTFAASTNSAVPSVAESSTIIVAPTSAERKAGTVQEINEIKQERTPQVLAGYSYRTRTGDPGSSKLTDQQAPIVVTFPVNDAQANIKITPVALNAGTLSTDYYSNMTFGSGVLTAAQGQNLPSVSDAQTARGVGLSVGFQQGPFTFDAGVTPLGFQYSKFTGGVNYQTMLNDSATRYLGINLSSRPVTDSLLSFAGTTDPRSGLSWGGVMASGARINFSQLFGENKDYGAFVGGSFHQIDGTNVSSNTRAELTTGAYKELVKTPNSSVKLGLSATGLSYNKDLSGYTYGNGGYFSPKQYVSFTVPLSFEKRTQSLTYLFKGGLGWQRFSSDGGPYYPNDPGMQAQATRNLSTPSNFYGVSPASTSSSSDSGIAYSLLGAMELQIGPQLFLGANLLMDNSGNYRQWGGGMNLRVTFDPITSKPLSLPASPLYSPYSPLGQ